MGGISSSQRGVTEEDNASTTSVYRYPPRSGNYFSTHFIMGGEKFDSPQPESFLFGENTDLNYLGSKPVPFPYPPPQANEPTKTLKALINIRRDSLHFTKGPDWKDEPGKYNISFTFDADVKTSITIYYLATEEATATSITYTPKHEHLQTPTYSYPKGAGQVFNQTQHVFEPFPLEMELIDYRAEGVLPVVIHCVADEGDQPRQSHITVGVIEKSCDGGFNLKTLKQKLFVDGLCYLIQEIYGVEKKISDDNYDDEFEDSGAECVVCMCDSRDTLILPCRHLCLCYTCADSLRYQASNCPICRAPFRALLQIRALQKTGHSATHPALAAEEQTEGVPPGYEIVSLVEALNGPFAPPPPPPLTLSETAAAEATNNGGKKKKSKRRGSKTTSGSGSGKDGKRSAGSSDKSQQDDKLLPPPAEAVNLELTESRLCFGGEEEVNIVDEKGPRGVRRSSIKSQGSNSRVMEDSNKIKLEVLSQDSLGSMTVDSEVIDEDLARERGHHNHKKLSSAGSTGGSTGRLGSSSSSRLRLDSGSVGGGSRAELVQKDLARLSVRSGGSHHDELDDYEEEDNKEPTTEDELLKEDKLFESYKKRDQIMHLTDDESLDAVGRGIDDAEGYFSVGSGEEDEVEIVSIRGGNVLNENFHHHMNSPRSSDQSSQESSTSVNSSKQLLKSNSIAAVASLSAGSGHSAVRLTHSAAASIKGDSVSKQHSDSCSSSAGTTSTGGRRRKPNRSSVAPSPDEEPIDVQS